MFFRTALTGSLIVITLGAVAPALAGQELPTPAEFQRWRLPAMPPAPDSNLTTPERAELGKALFFDTRLSSDGKVACGTCHDPAKGWSDGLPTAHGLGGKVLGRATPSVLNAAYNSLQMWDGRFASLEEQALGPMRSPDEMSTDFTAILAQLKTDPRYSALFRAAYPAEEVSMDVAAKAIAAFERTVVSGDTPFDRWLAGEQGAMTPAQLRGLAVFTSPERGNCEVCHAAPNFTDNGFHNLGLPSQQGATADVGRFAKKPVASMKGAFKTPSLRGVALTAPYFHDGSAASLEAVVQHYASVDPAHVKVSPNLKKVELSAQDQRDLVEFMRALTPQSASVPASLSASAAR